MFSNITQTTKTDGDGNNGVKIKQQRYFFQ